MVLLTDNPISAPSRPSPTTVGHEVVVIADDDGGPGLGGLALRAGDAVVLCDHDAPDAPAVLRDALASDASYVAMMASRRRAEGLLADLGAEGVPGLDKLHVPAGPRPRRQGTGRDRPVRRRRDRGRGPRPPRRPHARSWALADARGQPGGAAGRAVAALVLLAGPARAQLVAADVGELVVGVRGRRRRPPRPRPARTARSTTGSAAAWAGRGPWPGPCGVSRPA